MIFLIALAVFILACLFRRCWRQIKRTQMNKLYVSEAYRKAMLEKPDECELRREAWNIGVPDEQDLPAALRDGDIRPQDYNAPLSTPGVISPAEVEEAIKCMEQNAPWGYDDDSELEHQEHLTHMAALAVIRAALSQSTPVCRAKDDIPCGKEVKP